MTDNFPLIALIGWPWATLRYAHGQPIVGCCASLERPWQAPLTLRLSRAFEPTALLGL